MNEKYPSPAEILEFEPQNVDEHMSGRKKTFHNDDDNDNDILKDKFIGAHGRSMVANSFCALTENGERLRKQVTDGIGDEWKESVPVELHECFKLGNIKIDTECYEDIFGTPVDFDEFDCSISKKKERIKHGQNRESESIIFVDYMRGEEKTYVG